MTDSALALLLAKVFAGFTSPLTLAIGLMILSATFAALKRQGVASLCAGITSASLWVAATPTFGEWALGTLESQHPPRAITELPVTDVAIVLGGAIGGVVPPRVTLDLSAASDRVLHAARLYRLGKAKRILVTGGNVPWTPSHQPEAELIRSLLVEWGVPPTAIEIAGASRNTYENVLEIQAMWGRREFRSGLLVTSAAHMPRAMAVFKRAGIPVVAATTDVEVVVTGPWTPLRWLPDAGALVMSTTAFREWTGYWVYRIRGYI